MKSQRLAQQGVALILVLAVMAVISVLATHILEMSSQGLKDYQTQRDLQQARWFARAGEFYAMSQLKTLSTKIQLTQSDRHVQFPIEQGFVKYALTSLHNCLNLNSLHKPQPKQQVAEREQQKAQQTYIESVWRLLLTEQTSAYRANIEQFIQRAHDWTDSDDLPSGVYGAESSFYAAQTPAQQPANRPFLLPDESRYLEALPVATWTQVMPLLCVRPQQRDVAIHPNDLQPQHAAVLHALLGGAIEQPIAQEIIADRPQAGWQSVAEFWQQPALQNVTINDEAKAAIVMRRQYFSLITDVQFGVARFRLISLLYIDDKKKTHVLGRRYGVNA